MKKKKMSSKKKMAIAAAVGLAYLPIGVVLELTKRDGGGTGRRRKRR